MWMDGWDTTICELVLGGRRRQLVVVSCVRNESQYVFAGPLINWTFYCLVVVVVRAHVIDRLVHECSHAGRVSGQW